MPEALTRTKIKIKDKFCEGFEITLPHANLVLAVGARGYISCGYLDLAVAEKFSDAACLVKGVKTIDDLLKARIVAVTSFAESLGIKIGMVGQEALEFLV